MSSTVVAAVAPGGRTLTLPAFSAMNMRPSGAQSIAVGAVRSVTSVISLKPDGSVVADEPGAPPRNATPRAATASVLLRRREAVLAGPRLVVLLHLGGRQG